MFKLFKRNKNDVESFKGKSNISEEELYKELDKLSTETLEMLHNKICGNH